MFESISLSSTIGGNGNPYKVNNRQDNQNHPDLESIQGSTDEDLDPAEFLSPQSPELLAQNKTNDSHINPITEEDKERSVEPKLSSNASISTETVEPSDEEFNESMLFSLNLAIPLQQHNHNQSSESPLQYLQENFNKLENDLQVQTRLHKQALDNGSEKLHKIRHKIGNILDSISENQYSLHELYQTESNYNSQMLKKFKKWDDKRNKLIKKIQSIKSEDNEFGIKLSKLLDESSDLDHEINQLEVRLLSLKTKKKLLATEIKDTSSVLESRTSKYVKAFEELDRNGEVAILEVLRSNGVIEDKARELIRSTPVAAGFVDHYMNKQSHRQVEIPKPFNESLRRKSMSPPLKSGTTTSISPVQSQAVSQGNNVSSMGMQAYEPPSDFTSPQHTGIQSNQTIGTAAYQPVGMEAYEPPSISNEPEFSNQSHSSVPYDKGFNKGLEASEKFKRQLNQIFELYIKPLLEQKTKYQHLPSMSVDDSSNTIKTKIDLAPILSFIEHKIEAYVELSRQTGIKSTVYHKGSVLWKDTYSLIQTRENELQGSMIMSRNEVEKTIGGVLINSLNEVFTSLDKSEEPVSRVIENEAHALISALSMLPPSFKDKRLEYESKLQERRKVQPKIDLTTSINSTYDDSSSDYLYNINSNAIEHKVLKPTPRVSQPISHKMSNNKLVKGE
ncbi:hypothetical protein CLIB1444_01S10704 [[Candida] jaroonii]|uniref:Uncharacterized protein n=1 Tax=[Candida] jaroonii TaxID=467808 RepID=A0ACA9Y1Z9_9ASCO|nr:hypothetical protein CLIB1444_01S10704 [[Candida] jaroonii]